MTTLVVNDVTHLNPVPVWAVTTPASIEEVCDAIRRTNGAISVGGGHFSMGGQTASPGSLHIDMRRMNRVLRFSPEHATIRVQAGIRWCDIQRFVDPHGFAVKIMQTYANFTVGGALSVNCHGRYVGLGPVVISVRAIRLVLASGDVVDATPTQNADLFYGAIGGYCALGIIVEAELDLAENKRIERVAEKMPTQAYYGWFQKKVRTSREAVFHNADLYAPHYNSVRAVTWRETRKPATEPHRLKPPRRIYALEKYFLWAISETPWGKWRRERLIDPLLYATTKVHWRNYEAGYDVAELEPVSRKWTTYVLQEYFVPIERFDDFVPRMAAILQRHRVNALNVSVRHALADPGSLLAWAPKESFAFVLYYKQRTRENAKTRVAVWTREMIDAVLSCGGTYYLPYQPHGTAEQFHRAYPRAQELFTLKRKYDPDYRLRNSLWDKYYAPVVVQGSASDRASHRATVPVTPGSQFHSVLSTVTGHDALYRFLQNVYRIYPEDRFHTLITEARGMFADDESIYRYLQQKLPTIKPPLGDLAYALPSLFKQKKEMARQALDLVGDKVDIDGYVEIGTTGRYAAELRKHLRMRGPLVFVNDIAPTHSPVDIIDRGRVRKLGAFAPLDDYAPIGEDSVASGSVDLVSCYIGLHHVALPRLDGFIESIWRMLRPGGIFILRDHDVTTPSMADFVSLIHTVFNAGLGVPWEVDRKELRHFTSVEEWVRRLGRAGFRDTGKRLLQAGDPSDNVLMAFVKMERSALEAAA